MRNKFTSILLSILIAFSLWLYVVYNVSQEDTNTIYNIPVVFEGESLLNENGLMVTGKSTSMATISLTGTRSDLNKVNSNNITLKADLSKIYEPGNKISVNYTISYPGDVAQNAFTVESRSAVYINVEYRREKEVPVELKWTGTRSEGFLYDTENALLDYPAVTVIGPASVADQIQKAVVEIDLSEQHESISQTYRYTLCDAEGNAVDAEQITTNVEEVRLDLKITRVKEVKLQLGVTYGGGANGENTLIDIEPKTIRVSGSEAALATLGDTIVVGTVDLAAVTEDTEMTYAITLPESVTNETGISEATVSIQFQGLTTRTITIDDIRSIHIPEGMKADIITAMLTISVRGSSSEVANLTEEDIYAVVDFSNAEVGTSTFKATIVFGEDFESVGVVGSCIVSATIQEE